MKINVKQILAAEQEQKARAKPLPKIVIRSRADQVTVAVTKIETVVQKIDTPVQKTPSSDKDLFLKDLWEQMHIVQVERGKLATRTAHLVDEVAEKLRKTEGPAMANAFLEGAIAMPEIAEHYTAIDQWIDKAAEIYDQIKNVELYGKLKAERSPGELVGRGKTIDAKAISEDIRALDKLISKTNKKLLDGLQPKNKGRVLIWREKIERAKIQREDLKRKLNAIQYEARAQRTGE